MNLNRLVSMLVVSIATTAGCTSMSKSPAPRLPQNFTIEFKGVPGESVDTRYFSNSRIQTYEDKQLTRDRMEAVDFTVASHTSQVLSQEKVLQYEMKTTRKDGTVDLHELAFPELNEQIDYVMHANGKILKAGHFAPQSIFFVPSLPIPERTVAVGDTWTLEHTWFSARDGIPLHLEVVAIFKGAVVCETNKICVDLEISGDVKLVAKPTTLGSLFDSHLWGRVLFSIDRGDVVWSDMRSHEELGVKSDRMVVDSCMVSEMHIGSDYHIPFACDPTKHEVTPTPAL